MLNRFRRSLAGWIPTVAILLVASSVLAHIRADDRVRLDLDALASSRGSDPNYGQSWVPCVQYNHILNSGCFTLGAPCQTCAVSNVTFLGPGSPGNTGWKARTIGANCGNWVTAFCVQDCPTCPLYCGGQGEVKFCSAPTPPVPQ